MTIRLYLDKSQYSQHGPRNGGPIGELLAFPNVCARVKGRGVLMHLKAYAVDRERLRTGSGNFSQSGLAFQDNDLILVDDPAIVAKFETNFEAIWSRGTNASAAAAGRKAAGRSDSGVFAPSGERFQSPFLSAVLLGEAVVARVFKMGGVTQKRQCHARESGHPDLAARPGARIPAFAGMTQR